MLLQLAILEWHPALLMLLSNSNNINWWIKYSHKTCAWFISSLKEVKSPRFSNTSLQHKKIWRFNPTCTKSCRAEQNGGRTGDKAADRRGFNTSVSCHMHTHTQTWPVQQRLKNGVGLAVIQSGGRTGQKKTGERERKTQMEPMEQQQAAASSPPAWVLPVIWGRSLSRCCCCYAQGGS